MSSAMVSEYSPTSWVTPGEVLQDAIDERGITQAQLAERMGRPKKTINEIINGKAAITSDTALQLELVLGIPASFWSALESNYRELKARVEERERLRSWTWWLKEIPLSHMIKEKWIPKVADQAEQVRVALEFFQIASPDQWIPAIESPQSHFRKASVFETDHSALAAWLQRGKYHAATMRCEPFDSERFRRTLGEIRALTLEPEFRKFWPALLEQCAASGVALVLEKEVRGARVYGATHWPSKEKAIIQLSFRYLKGDSLWFTFFHEAGHILLHPREVFLETGKFETPMELEANKFAEEWLIPSDRLEEFLSVPITPQGVRKFASSIGIAPGIVVGRLQKEKMIPYNGIWESMKFHYKWVSQSS